MDTPRLDSTDPTDSAALPDFVDLFPGRQRTLSATSSALPDFMGQAAMRPIRLRGEEAVSRLFSYTLELETPEETLYSAALAANISLPGMTGRDITLRIELDGKGHFVAGAAYALAGADAGEGDDDAAAPAPGTGRGVREISAVISEARYLRPEGRHHIYGMTLRPWLWLATKNRNSRIFQDKSVADILDTVLSASICATVTGRLGKETRGDA